MTLLGSIALVTGGAKRVGAAIALELAEAGCNVAIHFRNSSAEAEQIAARIRSLGRCAITIQAELQDPASWPQIVDRCVTELGRLDILVNNASVFPTHSPDTVVGFQPEQWNSIFQTNLLAPIGLVHHASRYLAATGKGKIINLTDISADRPWPTHLAYCCSKAALAALTRGLAVALAPAIQVNAIAPGIAIFPDEYGVELRKRITALVPLGREGSPQDIAKTARFLAESDYVTGQIIAVDGGRSVV
ncbi:MAG: SDR family oxidoreductase [Planctomycetota bacterium]